MARPHPLSHIPGEDGWPIVGTTLKVLADPPGFGARMRATYGDVYRTRNFGYRSVALIGADANELVLFDRDRNFSSAGGWGPVLNRLFPRGLMLLDFDHHRADRRALGAAFKPAPMRHYADALNRGIGAAVAGWGAGEHRFYPWVKALALDLAAESFLGLPLGAEAAAINAAFMAMVQASVGLVRVGLPGTAMGRGMAGRRRLVAWFTAEVARRRAEPARADMFSQFAHARTEDGSLLAADAVVDHMVFLMMAAHDTITASSSALVWLLAANPDWQERLRAELLGLTGGAERALAYDDLPRALLTDMAFKEALRLLPPVPSTPRQALRDFSFRGHPIPAGTQVGISASAVHHDPALWPEPERFDPTRFAPEAVAARHKYAWVPFGGGAHMCLGLHFAGMQVKILLAHLLGRYALGLAPGYEPQWQAWPIPKPRDGLQITLTAL